MTYTPVIPASYSTYRVDLRQALEAIVDAFIVDAGYELGRKWQSALPDSFTGEGPLIVLGDVTEQVRYTDQLRTIVFSGSLFYVDFITDRDQTGDRVDEWADHMRDLFMVNRSTVDPRAVLVQTGFAEQEFTQGSLVFAAPSVAFEYRVMDGDQGGSPGP